MYVQVSIYLYLHLYYLCICICICIEIYISAAAQVVEEKVDEPEESSVGEGNIYVNIRVDPMFRGLTP